MFVCVRYIAEMTPPERRGSLGTVFQLLITVGILCAAIVDYVRERQHSTAQHAA